MEDKLRRVREEPDFVNLRKHGYSLEAVCKAYPSGVPSAIRARALMMTEEEAEDLYQQVVVKLRSNMIVTEEENESAPAR